MLRKILPFLFTFLLSYFIAFSQSSQIKIANNSLAKFNIAINDKLDSKKQLAIIGEGIKAIGIAEKDKKTKNWPETWAIKAYLCSQVAIIDENITNADKYFQFAQEAYIQAVKLDKYQSNTILIKAANHNLHVKMQQDGSAAFQRNDFTVAYEILKKVSDFMPSDTVLATNVALSAQNIQQYNNALTYYLRAKDDGAKNPIIFQYIANIYASKFENELAVTTLEEGLVLNPNHPFLMSDYINLLLDNEQYEKATKAVERSLDGDKRSKLLYFLYGYLQQNEQKNIATAEKAYQKALEVDYNYFEALYQLSVVYLQNANQALKDKNTQKFTSSINRAEYSLLRAHDINNNHRNTIKLLIDIYTRKNRLDKVQELKRKLNEF